MRPSTSAASVGVGVLLLLAWLASAVGVPDAPPPPPEQAEPAGSARLAALRADVEKQSSRLRERLAAAPAPVPPDRNPFRFASRPVHAERVRAASVAPPEPDVVGSTQPEAVLVLIGIAERRQNDALVRTAIISGAADDLLLVTEGQEVAGAYRVRSVSATAVELEHIATGEIRRLYLQ